MNKKIVDAMNNINDEYIEAAHDRFNFKKYITWANVGKLSVCGLCLFLAINIGSSLFGFGKGSYESAYETAYSEEAYFDNGYNYKGDVAYDMEVAGATAADSSYSYDDVVQESSKLIVNASMNIQTAKYDETVENVLAMLKNAGGYAQSTNANTYGDGNRSYSATFRIPSKNYEEFIASLKSENDVSYYSESVDDVTTTYKDLQARLTSLQAQEAKVIEFYNEAENIEDLMSIESRLSDLRYQIESIQSQIINYDLLTTYATLNINITESITRSTTVTKFSTRLSNAFINGFNNFVASIENIIISISYNIFTYIIIAVVILVVVIIVKRKMKNKK